MLEARQLVKRYPGVIALDHVDFSVAPGEVVGLIGENGAGKSSLIKILCGLSALDEGEVSVDGTAVRITSPTIAAQLGISVIHQELSNLDNIDVAGNIFLGREPKQFGFLVDRAAMIQKARDILAPLKVRFEPDTPVSQLSIAEQQLVEIAKALSFDAKYVIMDEPTSSLTLAETENLLAIVKTLRERGVGVVYVSHRLAEVIEIADRVIAFRDGKNAGNLSHSEITAESMIRLMVGRDVENFYQQRDTHETVRLEIRGLRTKRFPQLEVNLDVRKGEILGVAGLVGAGRTELVRAIFGVDVPESGTMALDGTPLLFGSPQQSIRAGILLVPEDRRLQGLVTSMNVRENISLPSLDGCSKVGLIQRGKETKRAESAKKSLNIKTPSVEALVSGLSGGNQQKVVLAKWLDLNPKVLIVDEPTRGIDVGARSEIYALLRSLADDGVSIIMVSSDMEEVLAVSDRVAVMREGRLSAVLSRDQATQEEIMKYAVMSA